MHIASFDDGSHAALHVFADELLDLWLHPVFVRGVNYRVVVGQILMDDKGREDFCGVQGATSLAGCNICHFEGRTFASRRVFDGIRRYLPCNDTRRKKGSRRNVQMNYHFGFDENRAAPLKRTYDEYKESAAIAEESNRGMARATGVHRGVKRLWVLDILPYAAHIHWTVDMMHCFNNVIADMTNSLRPTSSGDKTLYKHVNRTTADNVKEACMNEGIHEHLTHNGNTNPPWVFSKAECVQADKSMHKIIGACTFEERPLGVMKAGKASNSHDTIFWATTYARWCFRNKGCVTYTKNICEIFDIMGSLGATRLNAQQVRDVIKPKIIAAMVQRAGLLPPTECMLTLHELLHICDQVAEVGVPRVSSLYKFERMNHILKELLQNHAKGKCVVTSFYVFSCTYLCHVFSCLSTRILFSRLLMSFHAHICRSPFCYEEFRST